MRYQTGEKGMKEVKNSTWRCTCPVGLIPVGTHQPKGVTMSNLQRLGMLNREAMKAFNCGKVEDAMFQLIQAGRLARRMKSPLHEAKIRNNIGLVHQGSGNVEEARISFRLAQKSAVDGAGEDTVLHKVIARNLQRLDQEAQGRRVDVA